MKCPSCSAEIADTAKFCPECGGKIELGPAPEIVPGFHPKPGEPSRLSFSGPVSLSANSQSGRMSVAYRKLQNDGSAPTGPLEYRLWYAEEPYDGTGDVNGVEMGRKIETCSLLKEEYLEDISFDFPITGNPVTGDYSVVLTVHEYNEDGSEPIVAWTNFKKKNPWTHVPAWYVLPDKDGCRQLGEHVEIAFTGTPEYIWKGNGIFVSATLTNESDWDSGALSLVLAAVNEQTGETVQMAADQIFSQSLPGNATATVSNAKLSPAGGSRPTRGRWTVKLIVGERNESGQYDSVGEYAFPVLFEWNGKTLEPVH